MAGIEISPLIVDETVRQRRTSCLRRFLQLLSVLNENILSNVWEVTFKLYVSDVPRTLPSYSNAVLRIPWIREPGQEKKQDPE